MAPEDDFLARNGLRYGRLYGFAIDMSEEGPSKGMFRDDFHRDPTMAPNGAEVKGKFIRQDWNWKGVVRNFESDGSWDYQDTPPFTKAGGPQENYFWWNSGGRDEAGCKTEHISPVSQV